MKITKANISKLVCPSDQTEIAFSDDEVVGLVLRARSSGARAWYFRYRDAHGRSRRLKIGDASAISPDTARELARKAIAEVAGGASPIENRKSARHAQTCGELFERYLEHAKAVQRPTSFDGAQRHLRRNAASLAKEPVSSITRAAMRAFREKLLIITGPVQANRTLATLSACWSWALRNGVIVEGDNPASYLDKFTEQKRERVLTMKELAAIWSATAGGSRHDKLVRFLMLTCVRRGEAGGMTWGELIKDLWVIPGRRMKGGKIHEVVLSPLALAQLPRRDNQTSRDKHTFVFGVDSPFSGWSGAKKRLNKLVGFDDWGVHDFRRTFSTEMNARRLADPHIVESVLAHVGAKGGVAGVYNLATYRPEKKVALEKWQQLLADQEVFSVSPKIVIGEAVDISKQAALVAVVRRFLNEHFTTAQLSDLTRERMSSRIAEAYQYAQLELLLSGKKAKRIAWQTDIFCSDIEAAWNEAFQPEKPPSVWEEGDRRSKFLEFENNLIAALGLMRGRGSLVNNAKRAKKIERV